MNARLNEALVLTREEVVTIARFQKTLQDLGVQGVLKAHFAVTMNHGDELMMQAVGLYVSDVVSTDAFSMHTAGVSLRELVMHVRAAHLFPEDLLPSDKTVGKCLEGFWEVQRTTTA